MITQRWRRNLVHKKQDHRFTHIRRYRQKRRWRYRGPVRISTSTRRPSIRNRRIVKYHLKYRRLVYRKRKALRNNGDIERPRQFFSHRPKRGQYTNFDTIQRRFIGLKIWDYRKHEAFRRSWELRDPNVPFSYTRFTWRMFRFMTRISYLQKFLSYKNRNIRYRRWLKRGYKGVTAIRRSYFRLLRMRTVFFRRLAIKLSSVRQGAMMKYKLLALRRSLYKASACRFTPSFNSALVIRRSVNILPALMLRASFTQRVLKFNYQIQRVLLANVYRLTEALLAEPEIGAVASTNLVDVGHLHYDLLSKSKKNSQSEWGSFWAKFRIFKWFFEYRRWRRSYQLAMWFRKLRSYRRLKKEAFYLRLFRLYFYYLGEISEEAIVQLWRRFRRLDNRYQFTGLRFFQMLQMRVSNLLVFMGLAPNSVAGREVSRLGLVRINGFTKANSYAVIMAGDMLQFNIDIAFDYLTLFSDLYWVKIEAQSNFVGFLQVLFSLMLFLVLRWPRRYELSETDSRLNTRMIGQILRLFPVRIMSYTKVSKTRRTYDRHQNVIKMMPYKYRKSRRQILPLPSIA